MSLPPRAIRGAAWGVIAVGVATPLLRRRLRVPKPVVSITTAAAPVALCVALPRSAKRDVATLALQMWAYITHYEMPNDDADALRARVHIDYPVKIDRAIGFGEMPGARLQRLLGDEDRVNAAEQVLVWTHWLWFLVPHSTTLLFLAKKPERFPAAAASIYATFDLGLIGYWALPTAPPWYAAQEQRAPPMRRMMVEHGERFWKHRWEPLYSFLGGNPLAAMPSLHFATSVMAAHLLAELGPGWGAAGAGYAITLGFALVYLGEHYVIDLIAGLALTETIRFSADRATPLLRGVSRAVQRLESRARP